jgi:biotin carboxyl carrier protein
MRGMPATLKVRVKDRWYTVTVEDTRSAPIRATVDGQPVEVRIQQLHRDGLPDTTDEAPKSGLSRPAKPANNPATAVRVFTSPMPGVVLSLAVKVGDRLEADDEICVLEAMKMRQVLQSEWAGTVTAVHVQPGQQVADGEPIVDLE